LHSAIAQQGVHSPLLSASEEALFWRFVDEAPIPLLVADDARAIERVNEAWCEVFGYGAAEAARMHIDDLLAPESKPGISMRWADLMAAGAATARVGLICADGTRMEVRYSAIANAVPGHHVALFLLQRGVEGRPERQARSRRAGQLTLREQESLRLVALGLTTSAAADRLGISPETVRTHVRNAMNKLGARTRAQAIAVAMREGEIPG
jgi:PAS domain S-box-containing protein